MNDSDKLPETSLCGIAGPDGRDERQGSVPKRTGPALVMPATTSGEIYGQPDEIITMAHGSGGRLYRQLVEEVFLPAFDNKYLRQLTDAAVVGCGGLQAALTTDSFVVRPRFFPGGDIGRLSVCGTVNDLSMSGAVARYLTVGMILEAGLPLEELRRICFSMAAAAEEAGVYLVTGDTKVVERGAGDGVYINTAGLGLFPAGRSPLPQRLAAGDAILISGALGDHGLAVMAARENLGFDPPLISDVAPLNSLVEALLAAVPDVHALRDPTRGGIAAALNEWAAAAGKDILLEEGALPVAQPVRAAAALLGLDPLYVANEGKLLAAVPSAQAEAALAALRSHALGRNAAIIGQVGEGGGLVSLRTAYGAERLIDMPEGDQLPRIC